MRHKLFIIPFFFLLCGCLPDNQVHVSSSEDLATQGLSLSINNTVYRGTIAEVQLKLNYVPTQPVTAHVATYDGTALDHLDYVGVNEILTIPAGQTSVSFGLETFTSASDQETKSLQLRVSALTGTTVANPTLDVEIKDFEKGPFLKPVLRLTSGKSHNCVVLFDGRVKCWGAQNRAQTGTYAAGSFITPVNVVLDTTGIAKITSSYDQTCALYSDGKLVCWGSNFSGSYEGPTTYLNAGSGAEDIAVGQAFLCVVYTGGTVGCIGDNTYSQLGAGVAGANYPTTSPGTIPSITNAVKVYAGGFFACALLADQSAVCWGSNWNGDLGNGVVNANYMVPVVPTGLSSDVWYLTLGLNHACAQVGAQIKCWGANDMGQLGRGTMTAAEVTPDVVSGLTGSVNGVTVNGSHSCAVMVNESIYCWGRNTENQLGDGSGINSAVPQLVLNIPGPVRLFSAGYYHNCMVTDSDQITDFKTYCWGQSSSGEVSRATLGSASTPTDIPLLKTLDIDKVHIEVREESANTTACALINGGTLSCWGDNTFHQLGVGDTISVYNGLQVVVLPATVTDFSLGLTHGCALLTDGTIYCWGRNNLNQIADGSASATVDPAVSPSGLSNNFVEIKTGDNHSCALNSTGQVYCWGDGTYGQSGSCSASNIPQLIAGLPAIATLELKSNTSCAVTTSKTVYCWGSNGEGQFGNGQIQTPCQITPTLSVNGETVDKLALGKAHGCALMADGKVKCWGSDLLGQLGSGSASNARLLTPAAISSLEYQVDDIQAGLNHTCVLTKSSGVKCWGYNLTGQAGHYYNLSSTVTNKVSEPADVIGLQYGVEKLQTTGDSSCSISVNGQTKCWGYNRNGILSFERYNVPFPTQIFDQFQ